MSQTFADEWKSYYDTLLAPINTGANQVQETRRAFYAGAAAMLGAISRASAECGDDEDAGAAVIEKLHQELVAFSSKVGTEF